MPEAIIVRKLEKDDWEALRSIRLEALKAYPHVYADDYATVSTRPKEKWQDLLADPNKCLFGAFKDGKEPVGLCVCFPHDYPFPHVDSGKDSIGVMGWLYVPPLECGHGLAARLGKACIDWSQTSTAWNYLSVAHRISNKASEGVIKSLKFSLKEVETDRQWPDGKTEAQNWYLIDLEALRRVNLQLNNQSQPQHRIS